MSTDSQLLSDRHVHLQCGMLKRGLMPLHLVASQHLACGLILDVLQTG